MNYDNNDLTSKYGTQETFVDIFKTLAKSISTNINVASLCRFVSIEKDYDTEKKYGIAKVEVIPLNGDNNYIQAYFFNKDYTFESNEYVLVIYTNGDFREVINSTTKTQMATTNTNLHSNSFGIMIKLNNNETKE